MTALALAGCSDDKEEDASPPPVGLKAYRFDLEVAGSRSIDDTELRTEAQTTRTICEYDFRQFNFIVNLAVDYDTLDELRVRVRYFCPDRSDQLEDIAEEAMLFSD